MSKRISMSTFAFVMALCFISNGLSLALAAQEAGVLTNLEIGSNKTPIEYLRFPLDQPVSVTTHDDTATVSDQYTAKFFVTATAPANTDEQITINGNEVKSGAAHPVQLSPGANKIEIVVTGNDDSTKTYTVQIQK